MMLLALTCIIACSLAARGFQLQPRTIQSTATCLSGFSWADNTLKETPCLVAANVLAPCNEGTYNIPPLNSSIAYGLPGAPNSSPITPLTPCSCSWVAYNLISACTDCQGYSNATTSWGAYSYYCAGLLTNSYYPTNITLLADTRIPAWAITDPTSWTGAEFDAATAQSISAKELPDITNTPAPSTKSSIGPIVGGVVGGVVLLLAAILFGICLIRRTRRKNSVEPSPLLMANHTHLRSHSDVMISNNNMSTPNMSTPAGYTSLSSSPMRPSSPTIRTHASSSIRSFPFFSSGGSTISPSVRQQSPPPVSMHRDETAAEPFRLPPTNNHNPDRKQANGAYPVYDPPTAPPTVRMEVRSTTPTQGGRTRYNPPAYSEQTKASPEAGGSSSSRRSPATVGQVHAKKGSADTQHSVTSGGSAPRVGGSNPARGNVVNHLTPPGTVKNPQPQMNSHGASASTSANAITGHGRQPSMNSDTSRQRRPDTDDNFSVRDIA